MSQMMNLLNIATTLCIGLLIGTEFAMSVFGYGVLVHSESVASCLCHRRPSPSTRCHAAWRRHGCLGRRHRADTTVSGTDRKPHGTNGCRFIHGNSAARTPEMGYTPPGACCRSRRFYGDLFGRNPILEHARLQSTAR